MDTGTSTTSKPLSGNEKLPPVSSKAKNAARLFNSLAKEADPNKFPISQDQIAAQAKLHQTKRESQAHASNQTALTPMGDSNNEVFNLSNRAFFKVGDRDEKAAGTMEKIMWEFACIIGLQAQFVPTGTMHLYYDQAGGPKPEIDRIVNVGEEKVRKAGVWDAEGRIVEASDAAKIKQGGIQPALQGKVLFKWLGSGKADRPPIAQEEISRAIVTSLVFGMFDAHENNIFVTNEGTLKFFDNTKSMPHSNGLINRGNRIASSYRCSLLDMKGSRHVLTRDEKEQVNHQIKDVAAKMDDFKKYMEFVEESAESLPFGWLDTKAAFSAMQRRVERMLKAIHDPEVNTLLDLSMRTITLYKFSVVLELIKDIAKADAANKKRPKEPCHGVIGYTSLEVLFANLESKHINARQLIEFCEGENDYK
jgi:hypothetical protein